jgi:lipid-binding SYLF domain-containing protein
MTSTTRTVASLALAMGLMGGCSTAPMSQEGKDELVRRAAAVLTEWNQDTPGIEGFARRSHGYAMFPSIAKGGLGVGGAYGRGVVYEQGEHIGYADLALASLGLQVGGQAYRVLVVFDHKEALERFKRGRLDFSADATEVLLNAGYVANVRFVRGVTTFSTPIAGAMGGAAMGGQRVTFVLRNDRARTKPALPAAGTQ